MQMTISDCLKSYRDLFAPKPEVIEITPEQAVVEQAREIIALEDAGKVVPAAKVKAFKASEARAAAWTATLNAKPRSNKATIAHSRLKNATTQQLISEYS
ncbi:MAG: hypothetical protein JKY34_07420 [Kordiimonadaceae bacterium]|nr:hypothetical protein [Kordiimonadaceae bacterium]